MNDLETQARFFAARPARATVARVGLSAAVMLLLAASVNAQSSLEELEEQAFRAAVQRVAPSVVRIETLGGLEKVGDTLIGEGPTTGLVLTDDGYIVSSAFNFVQQPASILVTLADGKRAAAQIVARDSNRMLVLLKVSTPNKLTPATAVPRSEMIPGQWTIAVGKTFDVQVPNSSVGILSATNRIWGKAIQTDAKISPNNYGGPLIDIRGRTLGVLVPLSAQAHGEQPELAGAELYDSGIGFAVPLVDILARLERWKKGEDLKPGLLGVATKGRDVNSGDVEVAHVQPKSPAAASGIKVGDKIVELGGDKVGRLGELRHALGKYYAGEKVAIVVMRGSERIGAELTLADKIDPYEHPFLGLLPRREPAGAAPGVGVRWVYPNSPADKAGLRADDRVLRVGGKPVANAKELQDAVATVEPGQKIVVQFVRGTQTQDLEIATGSLPTDIPLDLPPAVAVGLPPAGEKPATGIMPLRVAEEANECLVYVPESYRADQPAGLLVWLHAAGGFDQKELIERWKPHCEKYGVILLAPKAANPDRWQATEVEFVRKVVDEVLKQYQIDPTRVVLHGYQAGGTMAWAVALARRDVVRGVAAVDAGLPLRAPAPENEPFQRLAVYNAISPKSKLAPVVETLVKKLREAKFPVTSATLPEPRYLNSDELGELMRWFDTLDRI